MDTYQAVTREMITDQSAHNVAPQNPIRSLISEKSDRMLGVSHYFSRSHANTPHESVRETWFKCPR